MPALFLIRFEPYGTSSVVSPGSDLLEAARRAGIHLASNCNGQGDCGECCVIVLEGQVSQLTREETECLSAATLKDGCRLACCTRVYSAARVKVIGQLSGPGDGGQRQHQGAEQQVEL
jgi:2Fe-2S ferredoxin